MTEIVNRIKNSSLIQMDLKDFIPEKQIKVFDLKFGLINEMILKEKEFRSYINQYDWSQYNDSFVSIICSVDAIIPTWSFMLVSSELSKRGIESHVLSEEEVYKLLIIEKIKNYPIEKLLHGKIIIKGCSEIKYPSFALSELVKKIQPKVDSIMFGEPCSTVPIYKKRIKK